jgi:hypothetical protein
LSVAHAAETTQARNRNLATLRQLLEMPEQKIDLAKAKLTIDRMIDPQIDISRTIRELDAIVAKVKSRLPATASSRDKLEGLQTYLYEPGEWNGDRAFAYDLDDPLGRNFVTSFSQPISPRGRATASRCPCWSLFSARSLGST